MKLKKISQDNLTGKAYQQIKEAIMAGHFRPGERLPIRQVAETMGTSITPVREALLKLVSYGALEMKPAHPITVPVLCKKEYLENRAIRVVNEGFAAAEATNKITKRQLFKLKKLNDDMIKAVKENRFNDIIAYNYAFHIEVCKAADMPILLEFIDTLWLRIGPSLNLLESNTSINRPKKISYHKDILQAFENKDATAARKAMEKDLVEGGESLLKYFEKTPQKQVV